MLKRIKPYLRWLVLGATLFFLAQTLIVHWQGVLELRLRGSGVGLLLLALGVTLVAHVWSGWVWGVLLRGLSSQPQALSSPLSMSWAIATYLRTNIAKYLPGNIWHFYSRLQASKTQGIALSPALLSIVLEPLLMAAAALLIASVSYPGWLTLGLLPILLGVHPRILNPLLQRLARKKLTHLHRRLSVRTSAGAIADAAPIAPIAPNPTPVQLACYPLTPLAGELLFVLLRGLGFLVALGALAPLPNSQIPQILGAFSLAWVLGLIVPGAPGGIGVFEATAIALLHNQLPAELILGAVAAYRLISTLAELIGAAISPLFQARSSRL